MPDTVNPNRWVDVEHGRVFRRRIRANGSIQVDKHLYYITTTLAKRLVLVHLDAKQRGLHVTLDGKRVGNILPLKDQHPDPLDLQAYLKLLTQEAVSIAHYRRRRWMQSGDTA